jgi:hypothetical protein
MGQLTLYIPDELEKELKRAAKRAKKSVSAYVAELAGRKLHLGTWPETFLKTYGSWEGDFPETKPLDYEHRDEF